MGSESPWKKEWSQWSLTTEKSKANASVRLPAIMQHIPWINPFITSIPFISSKMRAFSEFGVQQSKKRMALGTKRKDLFYYLVCCLDIRTRMAIQLADCFSSRSSMRFQGRNPTERQKSRWISWSPIAF